MGIAAILIIFTAVVAMKRDPTDRNVLYERQCRRQDTEPKEFEDLTFFCDVCKSYVHDRTKHCGECNR